MAPRGGKRRAPRPHRYRILATLAAVLALGIAVTSAAAGGVFSGRSDTAAGQSPRPASSASTSGVSAAAPSSAAPSPTRHVRKVSKVIGGVRIAKIPTVTEVVARMQDQGYRLTDPDATGSMTFRVGTFNVLGANHTTNRAGWASGAARMAPEMSLLRSKGTTVAGLQEAQGPQIDRFQQLMGGSWGIYPGTSLGRGIQTNNSIIWNKGVWELVTARTSKIPYFGGGRVAMPHIQLRHRATGQLVWFGNYHNPADVHGPAGKWRTQAVAIEAALARDLTADGTPMIITGDMNDRAEYGCPFTRQSGMHSANGVSTVGGACRLPGSTLDVDWIMGSADIDFSAYGVDRSPRQRHISDHPVITATAAIETELDTSDCLTRRSLRGQLLFCPAG